MTEVETRETDDRDDVIVRVNAAAWDEGRTCEHCEGSGRVDGGRRVVHSFAGMFGADWDADSVIELVRRSPRIAWGPGLSGHDLAVWDPDRMNGKGSWVKFDVPHPDRSAEAAS